MHWNAQADFELLLFILNASHITVDHEAAAQFFKDKGEECTTSTIANRVKRLRAQAKGAKTSSSASGNDATPSPSKGRRPADATATNDATSTKKRGRAKKTAPAAEANTDDEENGEVKLIKEEVD